jgi:hypothetical protein
METRFYEKQQFRQWWLWLLMSPLIVGVLYVIIQQLILGNPVGDKPMSDIGIILFALFAFCIICFLWFLRLETDIDSNELKMNYRPILKRHAMWNDIDKVEVIDYGFVGYGFRWWPKHGWIYNVGGTMGLKVYLKSGKHFTVGTQKPNALKAFLDKMNIDYSSATT